MPVTFVRPHGGQGPSAFMIYRLLFILSRETLTAARNAVRQQKAGAHKPVDSGLLLFSITGYSNHLEMSEGIQDRFLFRCRALGHSLSLRFGEVVILPHFQPALPLDLGDIQAVHLQPKLLQHIRLNLVIGGLALGGGQVKFIKTESVEQKYFLLHCDSTFQNLLNRIIKHRIYIFRLRLPQPL